MPRPRAPLAVAKAIGADVHNPQRYRSRTDPKFCPLGKAPKHLTPEQAECWAMFEDEMPWLGKSDRVIVETASRLRARMMVDPDFGVNAIAQLRMCLSSMGGTPADRSKVSAGVDEEGDDPLAKYSN